MNSPLHKYKNNFSFSNGEKWRGLCLCNRTFTSYYNYDAQGNRTRKTVVKGNITETRYYIGNYEIYRKHTNNALDYERKTLNISDDEKVFVRIETKTGESPLTRYQYDNHLGSACLELDITGAIISYEEYHPFGATSYRSGKGETEVSLKRYKYCGKERDEETGLYYYGMRYYAAWLCRFVSVDPLQFKYPYYTPYQYAGNKPITFIDLDGGEPFPNPFDMALGELEGLWNSAVDKIKYNPINQKINNLTNSSKYRTAKFVLEYPIATNVIGIPKKGSTNISTNAVRFSTRIGLHENAQKEGSQVNAFRHVLWQATITNRFDTNIAKEIGFAHEENPNAAIGENLRTSFATLSQADETIDLLNNVIGRTIGEANPNTNMQELALKTLDHFKEYGLWTVNATNENGNMIYTIVQEKLSQTQYDDAKEILQNLNSIGFTPQEQSARDVAAKQKLEQLQSTWGTMK